MVMKPTHGFKVLDVILSNLHCFYDEPQIVPPVQPDNPNKGKPSDHSGVAATPLSNMKQQKCGKVKRFIRPLPESLIEVFGGKLANESWDFLNPAQSPTEMVDHLHSYFQMAVESTFPLKKITVSPDDKPWFTEDLRQLKRQRQRIYSKQGRSPAYLKVKQKFDDKMNLEEHKYKDKILAEVKEGKRGSS